MKDILSDREVYKILEQYEKDLDTMETVTIVLGYDDGQTYYTKGFSFMYDDGIEIDLDTLDINVNFDGFAEHEVINPSGEASLYFNNITGKFECSEFSFYDIFLSRQQFEYWWTKKQVTKIQGWISDYEEKIDKLLNKYDERYGHIEKF